MRQKSLITILAFAVGIVTLTTRPAYTQETSGPAFVGTWNLDLEKSDFGKAPPPKSQKLVIISSSPTSEKWTLERVDAEGTSHKWSYDGAQDGKFRPMGDPDGGTFAFMKDGSIAMKDKSGKVTETGTSSMSADGKTMTIRFTHHGPDGDVSTTSVYQKAA